MRDVYVLGTGMVPFTRYRVDQTPALVRESGVRALTDAGCTFADVEAVYMAAAHPLAPRGILVAKELGLNGAPLQHVDNASATGTSALHEAWMAVGSGLADTAIVLAYDVAPPTLSVADVIESEDNVPPVALFAMWARRRMHDAGTRPEHLAMVAAKNWNYARENPYAVRRAQEPVTVEAVLASREVASPLRSMMCTAWCDGAGAVVLGSAEALERFGSDRPAIRLASSVLRSETYEPGHVFLGAIVGPPAMTRATVARSLEAAGLGPADLDVVQVHDAFAIEEIVYYELLGFTEPGETERLLEQGAFGPGSKERFGLPEFSTGGGLIARGHPGGPTGVAQVHETVARLRDPATRDRHGLCHMLGAGSMCVAQVLVREG